MRAICAVGAVAQREEYYRREGHACGGTSPVAEGRGVIA